MRTAQGLALKDIAVQQDLCNALESVVRSVREAWDKSPNDRALERAFNQSWEAWELADKLLQNRIARMNSRGDLT